MENASLSDCIFKSLSGQVIVLRKRIIAAALAATMMFTVGCGKKEEITPTTESGIEAVKTEEELRDESELAAIEESKEITPERVAALSRNAASMWKIAGGEIAAGVEQASGVPKNAVFGTEDDPDIESVLDFRADLILIDKVSENYQDMVSLLDMTEGAPPYLVIDIHSFDDYADSMLEMAKYTKDAEAYKLGVIDVRRKKADVIARGQEALKVLIQTMPLPEGSLLPEDESMAEEPKQTDTDAAADSGISQVAESTVSRGTESSLDSVAESYPADTEKVADKRESITVLLMRVDAEGCTIQGSHDYVSNMFADFGLINVNPGYEEVRVTFPKEEENKPGNDAAGETADNKALDSQGTESHVAESQAAESQVADSQVAESQAADSQVTDSPGTESQAADSAGTADGSEADNQTSAVNDIEFETILSRNPDYIFVIYEGKERTAEKTYKEICESREFWGDMTAVRNRHVYTLPQSTFAYPPNDQWDLAYEYLYQMMFVM